MVLFLMFNLFALCLVTIETLTLSLWLIRTLDFSIARSCSYRNSHNAVPFQAVVLQPSVIISYHN
jgi:hypothetical protein